MNAGSSRPKRDEIFFLRTRLNKRTIASYSQSLWPKRILVKGAPPKRACVNLSHVVGLKKASRP